MVAGACTRRPFASRRPVLLSIHHYERRGVEPLQRTVAATANNPSEKAPEITSNGDHGGLLVLPVRGKVSSPPVSHASSVMPALSVAADDQLGVFIRHSQHALDCSLRHPLKSQAISQKHPWKSSCGGACLRMTLQLHTLDSKRPCQHIQIHCRRVDLVTRHPTFLPLREDTRVPTVITRPIRRSEISRESHGRSGCGVASCAVANIRQSRRSITGNQVVMGTAYAGSGSNAQLESQPSPSTALPSSHSSPVRGLSPPSPH